MENSMMITLNKYNELISLETRVDIIVNMIGRDRYVNIADLLNVLGTERALEVEKELRAREERERKEWSMRSLDEE